MDAGGRGGTGFPKGGLSEDRKKEEGHGRGDWGPSFPNYTQRLRTGFERKRGGMCGDRPKPRGWWGIVRAGFVQRSRKQRKSSSVEEGKDGRAAREKQAPHWARNDNFCLEIV
jgi:hypothetical protein